VGGTAVAVGSVVGAKVGSVPGVAVTTIQALEMMMRPSPTVTVHPSCASAVAGTSSPTSRTSVAIAAIDAMRCCFIVFPSPVGKFIHARQIHQ